MSKKVVWAIFDDGEQSVYNALPKDKYEVYSFGILPKETCNHLNMIHSLDVLLYELKKFPKPDYIVASPPCIAFSRASGIEKGMNAYLHYDNLKEREKESFKDSMYKFENSPIKGISKKEFALMSKRMVINTLRIIEHFEPKRWYIENPRLSLIWRYIKEHLHIYRYENVTMYGAYNHPVKKPTIFLSDQELKLKTDTKGMKFLKWDKDFTNKSKRSSIPKELIIDIFSQFEEVDNEII